MALVQSCWRCSLPGTRHPPTGRRDIPRRRHPARTFRTGTGDTAAMAIMKRGAVHVPRLGRLKERRRRDTPCRTISCRRAEAAGHRWSWIETVTSDAGRRVQWRPSARLARLARAGACRTSDAQMTTAHYPHSASPYLAGRSGLRRKPDTATPRDAESLSHFSCHPTTPSKRHRLTISPKALTDTIGVRRPVGYASRTRRRIRARRAEVLPRAL